MSYCTTFLPSKYFWTGNSNVYQSMPTTQIGLLLLCGFVRERVATNARCGCSGTMHWNYSNLAAILMTSKIGILLLQMFN